MAEKVISSDNEMNAFIYETLFSLSQGLASLKQEMARLDSYIESRKVYSE
jgi:hypothetical protein